MQENGGANSILIGCLYYIVSLFDPLHSLVYRATAEQFKYLYHYMRNSAIWLAKSSGISA